MKKLFVLLSIVVAHTAIFAQPTYQVSSCNELGLNPGVRSTSGGRVEILSIYLEGTDEGIGGLGCWVHHHPNGKDYVVTPYSWGREPNAGKMGLIRAAMEAITDSRILYLNYGTLETDLYYILDDRDHDGSAGEKFWYMDSGDECWMRSGVPSMRLESREHTKQVFAHEIGHCFIEENVPKTRDVSDEWRKWMDESVAEYLASEVYRSADREHMHSVNYDYDALFTQPYSSYVLWYYFAMKNGIGAIVPLMNQLIGLKTEDARFTYLRSIGFDELFHHYLYNFMLSEIKDSGSGRPIPKPSDTFDETYFVESSATEILLPDEIEHGERELYYVEIPAGFNITLNPPTISDKRIFISLMAEGDLTIMDWKEPEAISGNCLSPKSVMVMISHLNSEEVGGLTLNYELEAKTDCCSGEGEPLDGCLIGTWKVDVSTISHLVDQDVSGTLEITFKSFPAGQLNATFDMRFDDEDKPDYDIHKGTLSACVMPVGSSGGLKYVRLSGVTLGPYNIHKAWNSTRGEWVDLKPGLEGDLEIFRYNYTHCDPESLIIMYMVQMARIR